MREELLTIRRPTECTRTWRTTIILSTRSRQDCCLSASAPFAFRSFPGAWVGVRAIDSTFRICGDVASAHLLVEHGLEHSAVLTFLHSHHEYPLLDSERRQQLLASSYNNLVDWHVAIERTAVNFIYVRATHSRALLERRPITRDSYDDLRSEIFEEVVGTRPQPNFPALDDALIRTISFWKRALVAELGQASNADLSRLFNAIIFARALEDQRRREHPNTTRALLNDLAESPGAPPVRDIIDRTLTQFVDTVPSFLFDKGSLEVFDTLDAATVRSLLLQFYDNRYAPYPYDFQ